MNDLQVFDYQDKEVRTVQIDGETWFVLKDVCSAIGIRDHVTVSKRLDEDEVGQAQVIDGMGRSQETAIVNESGLYSVILRSDKPEAKPFRKWVTSEVLPTLRKTGQYQMKPLSPAEMFAAQAQVNLDHERQLSELARRTEQAEKTISEAASVFAVPAFTKDDWQTKINAAINETVHTYGLNHQKFRGEIYRMLEEKAGVNLTARQNRMRERMRRGGATCREAESVTKLHVIAQDPKLREIFYGIVQAQRAQRICAVWAERKGG